MRFTLLVVLSMMLMIFDYRYDQLQHLRAGLSVMVAPIQYMVAWPMEVMDWMNDSVARRETLIEENANLRAQTLLLNAKMHKILSLQKENTQLRALLQSASPISDQFTVANLLAINSNHYSAELILDKGKKHHIYLGQPVLDANGVMGQIVQVGPLTSRLMLITDRRSAVPVQVSRNGLRAIAVGAGVSNELTLLHLTDTDDIRVGDILTTSGLDLRYPEGYPVGVVSKVSYDSSQHFVTVLVMPSAHLLKSRQVLLVWQRSKALYDETRAQLKDDLVQAGAKQHVN